MTKQSIKTDTLLTPEQRTVIDAQGESHQALELAQTHLHRALSAAQPQREREWAAQVASELKAAEASISAHALAVKSTHGLYREVQFEAPHLVPTVKRLERQLESLRDEAGRLAECLVAVCQGDRLGIASIRPDGERLLSQLRELIALENDLVFERFNEPPALD